MFRKTEDGMIGNLLRANRSRLEGPAEVCKEFDPDKANAYIERALAPSDRARYEAHLAACAPCRKSAVALARMAEADAVATTIESKPRAVESGWGAAVRRTLGALTVPQWAMAAAAVIIIAISIPLFVLRKDSPPAQDTTSAGTAQKANRLADQPANDIQTSEPSAADFGGAIAQQTPTPSPARPASEITSEQKQPSTATTQPAAEPATIAANETDIKANQAAAEKTEAAGVTASADEKAKTAEPQPAPPAPQRSVGVDQLAKLDREEARRVQRDKDDSAKMDVLKPGRPDGGERAAAAGAIRPEDSVAQPPSTPATRSRAKGLAEPSAISMREGRLSDSVRPPRTAERKINGKKFWLRDTDWTDKDYNPDKALPVVIVVRDSDTYNELLAKHSGLKPYFTGFNKNDRVIVVYKGIVYKLIPQGGNN
ncbi:MAG TPA: zf-HC2 domain-containing protein [Blastocatellia bacterium]|nr:zf-HC2 domain-containing protein [Blastocatellia bacterium]